VSAAAQAVIRDFLTVDRTKRLGCRKGGLETFSKLPFFRGIGWQTVEAQQLAPLLIPVLSTVEGDTSNFDSYPEEKTDEICNLSEADRAMFQEFDVILGLRS